MINTSVSKNEHTIQSGLVEYPIGFPFYFNPDRTPQLLVKIGDDVLRFNHNFELSEDKGSVVLRPTEEESWTLEGPEDFSWMAKWDGKDLLIERVVPFVQDSDYQLGRISAEQIERDFDLSVMRDQTLADAVKKLRNDTVDEFIATDTRFETVESHIEENANSIRSVREDFVSADKAIRDDMNAGDGSLQSQITAQDASISTNKKAIDELGKQVAGIESKIPESTSETNLLITEQQLQETEVGIRNDLNGSIGELRTQVTAQAAEIKTKQDKLTAGDNIIISGNVISATGAGGGAGFDIQVVQELPATGQKGIIYLLAKDGTAPDVYDEYVWITATQTFELIGTTQVDLSDYLPLSGGTLTGTLYAEDIVPFQGNPSHTLGSNSYRWNKTYTRNLNNGADIVVPANKGGTLALAEDVAESVNTQNLTVGSGEGTLYIGDVAGTATIATNNGLDIAAQTKFDTAPTTDDNTTYADALDTSLVRKAQVATAISDAVANVDSLPDQAGNAGKFLQTNGATASWAEVPAGGTKVIIKRYS